MKRQILRWTFIGLLVRFLIMSFSFHGHDIFFVYYFPFKFIREGAWNPYLFATENFSESLQGGNLYFPPGVFFIISAFIFLLKNFLPKLDDLFSLFESWNFAWQGNAMHYAKIFIDLQLFRTLFIFKLPYLIFDFGAGFFLFQILKSDKKRGLWAYRLWMLNPFVLHSCYALGQIDIIPTFFVMAAIYSIFSNRRYLAMVLFSFGVLAKIFPAILIPFAILLLGASFKERLKLSLSVILPIAVVLLPFYISSPNALINALFPTYIKIPFYKEAIFVAGYFAILILFFFVKRKNYLDLDLLISSFIIALLLFYSFYVVTIRYFILITPLLIYIALKNKRFWLYNILLFLMLFEVRAAGNSQQWGLFAAVHPEFFSSLPIAESYLNLLINVKYIHQIMYRSFVFLSLLMAVHILVVNRNNFEFRLSKLWKS